MLEREFNNVTANSIENTYKRELEKQIRKDIEEIGFNLKDMSSEIDLDSGKIKYIVLDINTLNKDNTVNSISIDKVEIGKSKTENTLSKQDIEKIKNALKEKYSIDVQNITINSA